MQDIYQVIVRGNFWGGRYYETGLDSIFVLADDKEDARHIAKSNIEAVETHFRNKKLHCGKWDIAKKDQYRFKESCIGTAKLTTNKKYNKTLIRTGEFKQVTIQ